MSAGKKREERTEGDRTDEELDKIVDLFRRGYQRLDPDTKQLLQDIVIAKLQEQVHEHNEFLVRAAKKIGACALILDRLGATPDMWREAEREVEAGFAVELAVGETVVAARAETERFQECMENILRLGGVPQRKRLSKRKNKKGETKGHRSA